MTGTTPIATTPPYDDRAPRVIDEPRADTETVRRNVYVDDGYSFGASFLGWCVAAFWVLVFTGIVAGAAGYVGAVDYQSGALGYLTLQNLALGVAIGFLVAQFLAYLIGGYAAGRMGPVGRGASQGLGTAAWGVVVAILLTVAGYALAATAYANYFGTYYPRIDWGALGGFGWTMLVLTLVAMFLGGALGGLLGTRGFSGARSVERRRVSRGRPL